MRRGKRKGSINLLRPARKRRRRNRLLVGAMMLASVLFVGHMFAEAKQTTKIQQVRLPTTQSRPQAVGLGDAGQLNFASTEAQTSSSLPAPEESCDDLRVLVDRSHTLPPYYVPDDLVSLWAYGVPTLGGGEMLLRREAAKHLSLLVESAAVDGEELVVASAYRSYADQQGSYARLTSIYGSEAGEMSAYPGHSQHQLGTAVDFTNAAAGYEIWQYFGDTSASWWLRDHAPEYGFVLAYPPGKETETGYRWEPWHYRYIGTKNAERLEESGMNLQAFLMREGVMPRC